MHSSALNMRSVFLVLRFRTYHFLTDSLQSADTNKKAVLWR